MFNRIQEALENLITKTYEAPLLFDEIDFTGMTTEIVNFVAMQATLGGLHNAVVTSFSGQEFALAAETDENWTTWFIGSPDGSESWEVAGNGAQGFIAIKVSEYLKA